MKEEQVPEPEATKKPEVKQVIPLWVILLINVRWLGVTSSGGGHASLVTLVVLLPTFVFATHLYFSHQRGRILDQIFATVPYTLLSLILVKAVADILFVGRELY